MFGKSLPINPFISHTSSLEEIETELAFLIEYAETKLDWEISDYEEKQMMMLTKLAKAKGSKRKW
jgi:hypothetical protein